MHRLFVALRPPLPVRTLLIDRMGGISGARWQDDAQLHITLRYIGDVERPVAEDVAIALGAVRAPPITLQLDGVGRFGDTRQTGGAVWAGLSPREPLAALHRKIDHALVRAGLAPERRAYLPHITVARLPRSAAAPDDFLVGNAGLSSPAFTVDTMLLFESHLSDVGATHAAIARYPLQP